jgi:hypothetical protein
MQSTTYFNRRWQCDKRTKDSSGYPRQRDPEFCMANGCPEFHQTVVDQSEETPTKEFFRVVFGEGIMEQEQQTYRLITFFPVTIE